jgi:hypothetical protein
MLAAILILLLILLLFGGGGFALHTLWYVLIIALVVWLVWMLMAGPWRRNRVP